MDFTAFDSFFDLLSDLGSLTSMIAEAFSYLPRLFIDYWSVLLIGIIVIGLMAIIIRLVS